MNKVSMAKSLTTIRICFWREADLDLFSKMNHLRKLRTLCQKMKTRQGNHLRWFKRRFLFQMLKLKAVIKATTICSVDSRFTINSEVQKQSNRALQVRTGLLKSLRPIILVSNSKFKSKRMSNFRQINNLNLLFPNRMNKTQRWVFQMRQIRKLSVKSGVYKPTPMPVKPYFLHMNQMTPSLNYWTREAVLEQNLLTQRIKGKLIGTCLIRFTSLQNLVILCRKTPKILNPVNPTLLFFAKLIQIIWWTV